MLPRADALDSKILFHFCLNRVRFFDLPACAHNVDDHITSAECGAVFQRIVVEVCHDVAAHGRSAGVHGVAVAICPRAVHRGDVQQRTVRDAVWVYGDITDLRCSADGCDGACRCIVCSAGARKAILNAARQCSGTIYSGRASK